MPIQLPVTVTTFRGTGPSDAGTANVGDVTLRITDADDAVTDIVFPGGADAAVFSAIRAKASELEDALNDAVEAP